MKNKMGSFAEPSTVVIIINRIILAIDPKVSIHRGSKVADFLYDGDYEYYLHTKKDPVSCLSCRRSPLTHEF